MWIHSLCIWIVFVSNRLSYRCVWIKVCINYLFKFAFFVCSYFHLLFYSLSFSHRKNRPISHKIFVCSSKPFGIENRDKKLLWKNENWFEIFQNYAKFFKRTLIDILINFSCWYLLTMLYFQCEKQNSFIYGITKPHWRYRHAWILYFTPTDRYHGITKNKNWYDKVYNNM